MTEARRQRVAFFAPHLGEGGADRVLVTILRHLDRARFEPMLILVRREGALLGELPTDVEVVALGTRRLAFSVVALARALRDRAPDAVVSTHGAANLAVALAHLIARSRARLVLSERSAVRRADRSGARRALETPAKRLLYRRAHVVTAVSEGVAHDLEAVLGVPHDRIQVVYNPMVEDDLAARAAEAVDHPWFADREVPVLVAVGRLVAIKDYPTLLDAFARIHAVRPARLFVLGDGPLRGEIETRARRLGVAADVHLHGFDKNPFKYMARADLLLHASLAEGLPGVLIQCMACGTPVVATDCDHGPREVIAAPGRGGFLVRVGDAAGLADAALRLLGDGARRAEVAAQGRAAATRFTVRSSLERYEAAIAGAREAAPW